jgi:hypothetical protein
MEVMPAGAVAACRDETSDRKIAARFAKANTA